jgi:hypothetical protein
MQNCGLKMIFKQWDTHGFHYLIAKLELPLLCLKD